MFSTNVVFDKPQLKHGSIKHHDKTKQYNQLKNMIQSHIFTFVRTHYSANFVGPASMLTWLPWLSKAFVTHNSCESFGHASLHTNYLSLHGIERLLWSLAVKLQNIWGPKIHNSYISMWFSCVWLVKRPHVTMHKYRSWPCQLSIFVDIWYHFLEIGMIVFNKMLILPS